MQLRGDLQRIACAAVVGMLRRRRAWLMAITHCAAAVPGLCAESRSGRDRSRQVLLSRCARQSTRWCCPASAGHAALTLSRPRAPCLQRHGTRETAARPAPDAEGQCMDALGAAKYRGATAGAQRYVGAILRTRCGRASTTQFCISQMHAMHQRRRGPLCWQLRCRAGHGNDDTMRLVGNSHGRCDGRDHASRRRHAACRCGQMNACRAIGHERRQRRSDR